MKSEEGEKGEETNRPTYLLHPRSDRNRSILQPRRAQPPKGGNWKVAILARMEGARKEDPTEKKKKSERLSPSFHAPHRGWESRELRDYLIKYSHRSRDPRSPSPFIPRVLPWKLEFSRSCWYRSRRNRRGAPESSVLTEALPRRKKYRKLISSLRRISAKNSFSSLSLSLSLWFTSNGNEGRFAPSIPILAMFKKIVFCRYIGYTSEIYFETSRK